MNKINIGLIQMNCIDNIEENLKKTIDQIIKIAKKGAQIICLQELFSSVYFCNVENYDNFKIADLIPGINSQKLSNIAKEYKIVIIASFFEKRSKGIYYNTAVVIDADGNYLGKYRKMHLPNEPHYHEKFYFSPGDLGYRVFKSRYAKIGVLICWDQWYPEAARIISLMGADILFYPTSIGWDSKENLTINKKQYKAWEIIQKSHSIANGIPIVSVNRVGEEKNNKIIFWGGSFITDSFGSILYKASNYEEESIVQEINLTDIEKTRVHWPFFRDRRIDSYKPITKHFIGNNINLD